MEKIRIGVICPSEIAFRRFMPALIKNASFEYIGIATASLSEWSSSDVVQNDNAVLNSEKEKAQKFTELYKGRTFASYGDLLSSPDIDAVYIPLPPALHYKFGQLALEEGKHVFMEKPFTTNLSDTKSLITLAGARKLAIHENYMFQYHSQLCFIHDVISQGQLGDLRLVRIAFGFPFRGVNDFRYKKPLGGGALFDCGGYTVKLASLFLGDNARISTANLNYVGGIEVDLFGSATMTDENGLTAQLSFGMDNNYKCEIEVWGSKGSLFTNRVLTAPDGFEPIVTIQTSEGMRDYNLPADDTFSKSIKVFEECVKDETARSLNTKSIMKQATLISEFARRCEK